MKFFNTEGPIQRDIYYGPPLLADDLPLDRPRQSGFILKPIDKDAALRMLDSFLTDSDPEEDRETLEFLAQAIDEHRAAVGARLMSPNEQLDLA
jgi:hypothetical protein